MLVRDIKPPIQRVIKSTTDGTVRYYRKFNKFVKTSKYGLPVMIIIISIFGGSIVAAIPDDNKDAILHPQAISSASWDEARRVGVVDLNNKASYVEFNNLNSAYINFTDLVVDRESIDEESEVPETGPTGSDGETSTTTKDTSEDVPEEPAATATEFVEEPPAESPLEESTATTTEDFTPSDGTTTEESTPSDGATTESVEEPPIEENPNPDPEASLLRQLRSKFITQAQLAPDNIEGSEAPETGSAGSDGEESPAPEPESEPTLEPETPLVEEPAAEPEIELPTIDESLPINGAEESPEPSNDGSSEPEVIEVPIETPEAITVFYESNELLVANFEQQESEKIHDESIINSLELVVSMAMDGIPGEDDALLIEYRENSDAIWKQLALLGQNVVRSNKRNKGYFRY